MPNWCNNIVCFEASTAVMKKIKNLFMAMAKKERKTSSGQLPHFITGQQGWFFDTRWEDDVLYYETRWAPNIDVVRQVADHFQCDYTHEFEEVDMMIYGKTTYTGGLLTTITLDEEDFARYDFNKEQDRWEFEGELYNTDFEILEILLEQKENNSKHH